MDGDKNYGDMCIADAANTVFTTTTDGSTSVVSAYALDVGEPTGYLRGSKDARGAPKLAAFQAKLTDLQSWLPAGSLGTEAPTPRPRCASTSFPYQGDPELPQDPIAWPLATSLDGFSEAVEIRTVAGRDVVW